MTTSPNLRRRAATSVAAVLGLSFFAGCVDGVDGTGTRAGGEPPPVTLRMGTDDPQGRPASDQIEQFAREVDERSDGRLRIEPVFRAAGTGNLAWDQEIARLVAAGDLDLGMIPARAWDTEGVDSLRALHAPFLVASDEHLKAVVSDDTLTTDLLAGLDDVGVTGLALLPEGLRRYFAFDSEEVTLATFEGARIRAPRSDTTWALLKALGGRPTAAEFDETMAGAESEFALAATFPRATAVLGNLTFFPKVNSLVANGDRFEELSAEHRRILHEAAMSTRDWAVKELPEDAALAVEYCRAGGTVVLADESELAAFDEAARPVIHELRGDDVTAVLMDRIEQLGEATRGNDVRACSADATPTEITSETLVPDGGGLPDGTYRVEFDEKYLESYGLSPELVNINRGVWTIDLRDGRWSVHQVAPDTEDTFSNAYQVVGEDLYWRFYESEPLCHLRWSRDAHGDLTFEFVDGPADAQFHFGLPWQRVG